MATKSIQYVLALHIISDDHQTMAMFDKNDERVSSKTEIIDGVYANDKSKKGLINGQEKGFFYATNGDVYIIFNDHSALKREPIEYHDNYTTTKFDHECEPKECKVVFEQGEMRVGFDSKNKTIFVHANRQELRFLARSRNHAILQAMDQISPNCRLLRVFVGDVEVMTNVDFKNA